MAFTIAVLGVAGVMLALGVLMHWPKLDEDRKQEQPAPRHPPDRS